MTSFCIHYVVAKLINTSGKMVREKSHDCPLVCSPPGQNPEMVRDETRSREMCTALFQKAQKTFRIRCYYEYYVFELLCTYYTSSRPNGAANHSRIQWSRCAWLRWLWWHHCVSVTSSEEPRSLDVIDLSPLCLASSSSLCAQIFGSDSPWICFLWNECFLYRSHAELWDNFILSFHALVFTFQPNFKCLIPSKHKLVLLFLKSKLHLCKCTNYC